MDPTDTWRPLIRALLYPIIFEAQPSTVVDRVRHGVVERQALGATAVQYLAAIRQALASPEDLHQLLPLGAAQSEATIREYLAALAQRLEARP